MKSKFYEFLTWAETNGWTISSKTDRDLNLDLDVRIRYNTIPDQYLELLRVVKQCISSSEQTWFLCEDEYNHSADTAFRWNEFELLCLEAAVGDDQWSSEIKTWWDHYLPIVISVHGGYSFYAIDLFNEIGSIVRGEEPEFEEVTKVADHIDDFLQRIMSNSIVLE
ncbi:SMI1/KNR4 family protein [Paenibacillus pabuli]|uniref:SMI1/KNR4 family protein n=1 Tax=Paenibacillus pabuli TaxID=1472 RepID=UPI001FFF10F8|nr:SMI1/KNR4 family protein [Paenibacillus pabuli]UPK41430.1 SMI1/KNR4 family protein [Paenibacillus pabuli]